MAVTLLAFLLSFVWGWCVRAERSSELTQMGQGCGYYIEIELLTSPSASSSTPQPAQEHLDPAGPTRRTTGLVLEFHADVPG